MRTNSHCCGDGSTSGTPGLGSSTQNPTQRLAQLTMPMQSVTYLIGKEEITLPIKASAMAASRSL